MKEQVNFEPLNQDILVEFPLVNKETDAGLIKSPTQLKEEQEKMDKFLTVVAINASCKQLKVGDKVFLSSGNHPQIKIDGTFYLVVHEMSILGKRVD